MGGLDRVGSKSAAYLTVWTHLISAACRRARRRVIRSRSCNYKKKKKGMSVTVAEMYAKKRVE